MSKRVTQKWVKRINLNTLDDTVAPPGMAGLWAVNVFLPTITGKITGMNWELSLCATVAGYYTNTVPRVVKWPYGNVIVWMIYRERNGIITAFKYPLTVNSQDVTTDESDMVDTGTLCAASCAADPFTFAFPYNLTNTVSNLVSIATTFNNNGNGVIAAPAGTGTITYTDAGTINGNMGVTDYTTTNYYGDSGGSTHDKTKGKNKAKRKMTMNNDLIRFTGQYLYHGNNLNTGHQLIGHITIYYES